MALGAGEAYGVPGMSGVHDHQIEMAKERKRVAKKGVFYVCFS